MRSSDDQKLPAAAPENDPQRKTQRYPYREKVKFLKPAEFEGETVDIGAGGVGVEVPVAVETGADITMEIFQGHAIALGTVRWSRPHEGRYRLGIQFQDEDWSIIARVQALRGLRA